MIKGINLQLFAKAAKGFSKLRIFPITTNTTSTYTPGVKVDITGAQSFSAAPETTDWKINADDGIYDSGSDWNGMKFTLNLAECPLTVKHNFEGGVYDAGTKVYTYKSDSQAPEIGMAFQVLQSDGTKLMVRIFSAKCTSFKMDYKTKGESGDIAAAVIEGLIQNRKTDNAVKEEKESVTDADLTWLDVLVDA
jgi:phi13 family phage major tail protein